MQFKIKYTHNDTEKTTIINAEDFFDAIDKFNEKYNEEYKILTCRPKNSTNFTK